MTRQVDNRVNRCILGQTMLTTATIVQATSRRGQSNAVAVVVNIWNSLIMPWKLTLLTHSRIDWINSGLIKKSFITMRVN